MSHLPAAEQKAEVMEAMFDRIAPRYDLVNHVITGGFDVVWRRTAVRSLRLPAGSRVADLACGTGAICRELERAGYRALGIDRAAGMLARVRGGGEFIQADILDLPLPDGGVDGVTCGFALRNVDDIGRCFGEIARVLRTGGRVAILDLAAMRGPASRIQRAYLAHVVPLVGGLLSDRQAYRYLPESTAYLPSAGTLVGMLREAGLPDARRRLLGLGSVQLLAGTRA